MSQEDKNEVPLNQKRDENTEDDDEEDYEETKRLEEEKRARQEAVKKRKEELKRKAEERRKKERTVLKDEEDDGELVETVPPKTKKITPALREDLVSSSVNFLNHPKVKPSPLAQKMAFLQKKGLTQEEIQEAINRANGAVSTQTSPSNSVAVYPQGQGIIPVPPAPYPAQQMMYPYPPPPPPPVPWYGSRLGLFATAVSCIGMGVGFALLAQKYLSFGKTEESEKKTQEEKKVETKKASDEVASAVKEMQVQQNEMRELVKAIASNQQTPNWSNQSTKQNSATEQAQKIEIAELKAELKKLKAMVLDNKSTNSLTQSVPNPSIAGWSPSAEPKLPAWMEKDTGKTPLSFDDPYSRMLEKAQNRGTTGDGPTSLEEEPRPKDFSRVLQMVQNGQIPDDIKPINDKPIDPNSKIERGQRTAPQKPWEKRVTISETTTTDTTAPKVQEVSEDQTVKDSKKEEQS